MSAFSGKADIAARRYSVMCHSANPIAVCAQSFAGLSL
jgi:hypothetical protein